MSGQIYYKLVFKLRYLASWCSTLSESSWHWIVSRGRLSLAQTNYIPILTRFDSTFQFHRERRTPPHGGYCDRCVLGLIQSNWKVTWRLFTFNAWGVEFLGQRARSGCFSWHVTLTLLLIPRGIFGQAYLCFFLVYSTVQYSVCYAGANFDTHGRPAAQS